MNFIRVRLDDPGLSALFHAYEKYKHFAKELEEEIEKSSGFVYTDRSFSERIAKLKADRDFAITRLQSLTVIVNLVTSSTNKLTCTYRTKKQVLNDWFDDIPADVSLEEQALNILESILNDWPGETAPAPEPAGETSQSGRGNGA